MEPYASLKAPVGTGEVELPGPSCAAAASLPEKCLFSSPLPLQNPGEEGCGRRAEDAAIFSEEDHN